MRKRGKGEKGNRSQSAHARRRFALVRPAHTGPSSFAGLQVRLASPALSAGQACLPALAPARPLRGSGCVFKKKTREDTGMCRTLNPP